MFALADGTLVLAATDLTNHLACAHLTQQRLGVVRGERNKPRPADDPHADLVRERGERHEDEHLARLSAECGGHVDLSTETAPYSREALEAAAEATAAAMRDGAPLIYQAQFFDGRWQGRADFLRRISAPSDLGAHAYEVLDTKLAKQIKPAVVHQLSLYNRMLAEIQGLDPRYAHVVLGTGEIETVDLSRYAALHRRVTRRLEAVVAAPAAPTYPEPVSHCAICALADECRQRLIADDHLSLVAGARRDQRERLVESGIATMTALATTKHVDPLPLSADRYDLLHHQADLQVRSRDSGQPLHRHLEPKRASGYALLPEPSAGDVFFDLEGDPYVGDEGIEYLWGWWSAEAGYECAWAHDLDAEKTAFERFIDRVVEVRAEHPGMHVFHYAPHERSKLRSLSVEYGTREAEVDELLRLGVLVDLFELVRHAIQVGEESYSLKSLERHHEFKRREEDVLGGGGSILMYERWLEAGEPGMLEAIRAYNEDDCRSTASLHHWLLERMLPEAEAELGVDFAELAKPEADEERTPPAWLADVEDLSERLLGDLPADPEADTPEQSRSRLLGHLILYHHRESKPEWWRHYDLRSMSADDLIWERDAVGEVTRDLAVEPIDMGGSWGYTYTFPAQEFKLPVGKTVADPITDVSATLREIEPGRLVLSRRKGDPAPEPVALVGPKPIGTDVLRDAVVEVAVAVADGSGHETAVTRLLDRIPPDIPEDLLGEDVEQLIDACLELGDGVLPIQGPPGTGKTYRAARMIVGALASGLRVGVTAQSHAAIQNVLREVEDVAREWPFAFEGVYRGSGYESVHGYVESKSGAKVNDEHRLIAGTAWLFASPSMRGSIDLLFVDEAGQYSLANAVAAGTSAKGMVLLGDPQQLPQVTQAEHPFGSGASALEHLLDGADTIEDGHGVLLTETWRMHPEITTWISERSYEGKLASKDDCANRRIGSAGALEGAGLRTMAVEHVGRNQYSPEEAAAIGAACRELLADGTYTDHTGTERQLEPSDVMVVAPYNMAVDAIAAEVPDGVRVGTVDRFQGQEAPVVFYALTCSAGEDVPRGLDFLFDRNRMNVAISRAQALAVLVHSPRLLEADCPTLEAMELLNGICRFVEVAEPIHR